MKISLIPSTLLLSLFICSGLMATLHADVQGQVVDFIMEGTIDGDKMTGSFTNPAFGTVPFTASKAK